MENLAEIAPLAGTLGIEVTQADPEEVRGGMDWGPEKCTAAGVLHGGALMALFLALFAPLAAQTGNVGKFEALNEQVVQLYKQGKYTEAAAIAEQSLALVERTLGRDHPHALTAVNNLAMLYKAGARTRASRDADKRQQSGIAISISGPLWRS